MVRRAKTRLKLAQSNEKTSKDFDGGFGTKRKFQAADRPKVTKWNKMAKEREREREREEQQLIDARSDKLWRLFCLCNAIESLNETGIKERKRERTVKQSI
jgi:hypothetical protein